jgi:ATP-dependent RNA circularization protein (DNA/RNA ligase family)
VDQSSRDGSSEVADRRAGTGGGGSAESETSESKIAVVAALLGNAALTILTGSIRTMHVGPHEIIAMLNVRFRNDLTATDIVEAIARLHLWIETALAQDVRPRFVAIEPTGLRRSRRAA